jgi:hypothetical protein
MSLVHNYCILKWKIFIWCLLILFINEIIKLIDLNKMKYDKLNSIKWLNLIMNR